ncbi:KRAB-A domain-containing protein 2-like [Lingula anatina]|uniref:KRAB-A domain-containing protein 2-like n=1 Tax=Lingula anatina TaxID=7574 RepID=A0A1S3KCN6_LINAN|nr:KRAB-A domain-containing protein 2-like [Lingula anatina]|eukprot:XP_013420400.1 KRAB-A domain-containing protein 2-like [Lingula anatina]
MSSREHHGNRWILYLRDHFSKFSWSYALSSKCASEVAEKLTSLFCLFGPPRILQSDDGREFSIQLFDELATVEMENEDLLLKLGKWVEENPHKSWVDGLQYVTYTLNTTVSSTTAKSPYEVVFRQPPHTGSALLGILVKQEPDEEVTNEEDMEGFFTDCDQLDQTEHGSGRNQHPSMR